MNELMNYWINREFNWWTNCWINWWTNWWINWWLICETLEENSRKLMIEFDFTILVIEVRFTSLDLKNGKEKKQKSLYFTNKGYPATATIAVKSRNFNCAFKFLKPGNSSIATGCIQFLLHFLLKLIFSALVIEFSFTALVLKNYNMCKKNHCILQIKMLASSCLYSHCKI